MYSFKYKDFYHSCLYTIKNKGWSSFALMCYMTHYDWLRGTQKAQDHHGPRIYTMCQVSPCSLPPHPHMQSPFQRVILPHGQVRPYLDQVVVLISVKRPSTAHHWLQDKGHSTTFLPRSFTTEPPPATGRSSLPTSVPLALSTCPLCPYTHSDFWSSESASSPLLPYPFWIISSFNGGFQNIFPGIMWLHCIHNLAY